MAALSERFIVRVQTTALGDPRTGSLHGLAPGQDDKTVLVIRTQNGVQE